MSAEGFMKLAIQEAKDAVQNGDGTPFGAVIVKNGEVICSGHNMKFALYDPTAHGEVVAIRKACQMMNALDLAGCELYTSCYPCPMCYAAAHWARITKIFYSTGLEESAEYGFRGDLIYKLLDLSNEGKVYVNQLEVDGHLDPFKLWNEKLGSVKK